MASDWDRALAALRAYAEEHNHSEPPVGFHMPDGRDLAIWVALVRAARKRGELSPERIAQLESVPGWRWKFEPPPWAQRVLGREGEGDRLRRAYDLVIRFAAEHGRMPKFSEDQQLRRIAEELERAVVDGTMPAHLAKQLTEAPGWPPSAAGRWQVTLKELKTALAEQGCRLPLKHRLAIWLRNQQARRDLDDEQQRQLAAVLAEWNRLPTSEWMSRYRRFMAVLAHPEKHRPSRVEAVRRWVAEQHGKAGVLPAGAVELLPPVMEE
ncbi:helicase associated domain-containing protein [Micromonospora sp. WMMD737]|uniref:helicase associated domain-containing protein n=1 Tax=Micromonospora sp. WMMD737 TaxID=3404113 RepID=UPI003B93FC77